MDTSQLQSIIQAQLAILPFTVSGALLESPAITSLFTAWFGDDSFVLDGASGSIDLVVSGTMTQSIAGLETQHAVATFGIAEDGVVQISIAIDQLPAGWTPSATFPQLTSSIFDQFSWSSPLLTLSTTSPPLPEGFPANFGCLPYSEAMIAAELTGLTLSAAIAPLVEFSGPLEWLLSGSIWTVSGPVVLPAGQISIALQSEPQTGLAIGSFTIPFSLSLASVALQPDTAVAPFITSVLQLAADAQATGFDFQVVTRQQTAAPSFVSIGTLLPANQGIDLDQVAALIGSSVSDQIPAAGDFPVLDDIQLTEVLLAIEIVTTTLASVSATVEFQTANPYPVFDGLITFDGLKVTFTYIPAGYSDGSGNVVYVSTCVVATATVSGGTLDASLMLPSLQFSCELAEGSTIDIKSLVTATVGDSISMPALTCDGMKLFGDIPGGFYRFQVSITDDWTFGFGDASMSLTSLGMDITKEPSGFSGQIVASLVILKEELVGRAEFDTVTAGWQFSIGTLLPVSIDLADLIAEVASMFGIDLPASAPSLVLTSLLFELNTATKAFALQCGSSIEIAGVTVDFGVQITNDDYQGFLWIGDSYFLVDFKTSQTTTLSAVWTANSDQSYLTFGGIAAMLGLPPPNVPEGLDLDLSAATLAYDFTNGILVISATSVHYGSAVFAAADGVYFGGLSIPQPISISNLPILGEVLSPSETAAIDDLTVLVASGPITSELAATLNGMIPAGQPQVPAAGMATVFGLSAVVDFGGTQFPVVFGVAGTQNSAATTNVGPAAGTNSGSVTSTPPAASDGTAWFNIQKTFGPMTLSRAGLRYSDGALGVLIDGSVSLGGMTLTLAGASVSSPITSFAPRFALQGIGLDLTRPPIRIGGGFLIASPSEGVTYEYDGSVTISTPAFSLLAYGSYADVGGQPSLFLFAQVSGAFGGPPAFFVTGILAGFGYNSMVRIPAQTEIIDCPLVAGLSNANAIGGSQATPVQALAALTGGANPWVAHALGEQWLAVGLQFTSFELFDTTALFVADFGARDLTLALLGITTAVFPRGSAQPYAEIQMQLEAVLQPSQGIFSVTGNLTPASFVIDRNCVLTGGFAFYSWFEPSVHAGDFVITIGGYNPNFDVPAWYPLEPPVGFNWSLDANTTVDGSAYLAMTPSALMAGGSLSVNFHDGGFNAWLTVWADMILFWKPFHFDVTIGVSIGASYTISLLFVSITLKVELAAELELWGPPTGGQVYIDWYVISFTVGFGAPRSGNLPPLTWDEFTALLASPQSAIGLTALAGLASEPAPATSVADNPQAWHVRGNGFAFSVRSAIPASELYVGQTSITPVLTGDPLNIRPMQQFDLTSTIRIWINLDGLEIGDYAEWTFTPSSANLPKALWGQGSGSTLDPGNDQLISGLTGFSAIPPAAVLGLSPGFFSVADALGGDTVASGICPLAPGQPGTGEQPVSGTNTIALIESGITAAGTIVSRNALYAALVAANVDPGANGLLDLFAASAGELFTSEPMLIAAA